MHETVSGRAIATDSPLGLSQRGARRVKQTHSPVAAARELAGAGAKLN